MRIPWGRAPKERRPLSLQHRRINNQSGKGAASRYAHHPVPVLFFLKFMFCQTLGPVGATI